MVKSVKMKKIYPSYFKAFTGEAYLKLKPNSKNTFILSKYKMDSKSMSVAGNSHQYVSLHEIMQHGNYRLVAYILPKAGEFTSRMYTEYGIFVAHHVDDEDDIAVFYAASWEHVKCQACGGSGSFRQSKKLSYAEAHANTEKAAAQNSRLGRFNAAMTTSSMVCRYSAQHAIGCEGSGIEGSQIQLYENNLADMYESNKESIELLMEFAKEKISLRKKKKKED